MMIPYRSKPAQANISRALKALEHLYRLHLKIPILIKESGIKPNRGESPGPWDGKLLDDILTGFTIRGPAFFEFWLPILSGLSQQSYHPAREVRQHALTLLQRALLSPELEASSSSPDTWTDVFDNVLFPLLDELLKADVGRLDPTGIDETRMRASGLLCQIFLQYLPRLIKAGQLAVVDVWTRVLEYVRKYLIAGQGKEYLVRFVSGMLVLTLLDTLDNINACLLLQYEAVLERLKNMLLVMTTQGVFQPTETMTGSVNLWNVTWSKIDEFLPGLKDDLFPAGAAEAETLADKQPTASKLASQDVARETKAPPMAEVVGAEVGTGGSEEASGDHVAPVVVETPVTGGSVISQVKSGEAATEENA